MSGEEATHIPIKGPEDDTDPATQKWRAENWEKDEKRAEKMADSGKRFREEAIPLRYEANYADQYREQHDPEDKQGLEIHATKLRKEAEDIDELASKIEEAAGKRYDREKQESEAAKRVVGEKPAVIPPNAKWDDVLYPPLQSQAHTAGAEKEESSRH